jgi:serine/threonine-protein kinase
VARPAAVSAATVADVVLGIALYLAPEQVTGRPVTPATDVYALGAVAYHCLAGRPPFTGQTPLQIALRHLSDEPPPLPPDVPPALRRLIARAMNKDPAQRYRTAADFATAVRATQAGHSAARSSTTDRPVRPDLPGWIRRARRRAAPQASAVVMLLLGAGALTVLLGIAQPGSTSPGDRPSTSPPSASAVAAPAQTTITAAAQPVPTQPDASPPTVGAASAPPPILAAQASQVPASATPSATPGPSAQPTPTPSSTTRPSDPPTLSPSATIASATPTLTPSHPDPP